MFGSSPPEYYKEILRLRGLHFPEGTVRRPQYFGHLTNDIVPDAWHSRSLGRNSASKKDERADQSTDCTST